LVTSAVSARAIRNGVIRNWGGEGVAADFSAVHAEDLRLDANALTGMFVGPQSIVRNTTATQNGGNGITLSGQGTIIACTAFGNTATGLAAGINSVVSGSVTMSNQTGIS